MTMCTTEERIAWAELVAVGRIAKSHGRHGEMVVSLLTDFPERVLRIRRVYIRGKGGEPVPMIVEAGRLHKGRPVVKLAGIATIDEASALAGQELRIPESEVMPLPAGSFYHYDIIGLEVVDPSRGVVGTTESVLPTGGTDVLVVRGPGGEEVLLPLCEAICRRIDPACGCIEVDLPEGLIDLNAN